MKKGKGAAEGALEKCIRCGNACCRYFTIDYPTPRSILDFDNLLWQLCHENTKAFKDASGWYLLVENPCVHLTGGGKCAIYENRPITCSEHSGKDCEFDAPIVDSAEWYFDDHEQLEAYCRKRFRTWDKRYRNR